MPQASATARAAYLIAPVGFALAAESARDNRYMDLAVADGFRDPTVPRVIAQACAGRAIWLTPAQKQAYAGNAITLSEERVWMSAGAADALTAEQREALAGYGFAIGTVALDEIEKAGGSLRCCVGEIF